MLENGIEQKLPQKYIDAFKKDILNSLNELFEKDTDEENAKCFLAETREEQRQYMYDLNEDSNEDTGIITKFTDEELDLITDEVIAYLKSLI